MVAIVWEEHLTGLPPVTLEVLESLEGELGRRLPDDYRSAVLIHAGKMTDRVRIPMSPRSQLFGPLHFISRDDRYRGHHANLHKARQDIHGWLGAERSARANRLVPIAGSSAGGYFCLDFEADGPGYRVVFVDLEREPGEAGAFIDVAASFTEALAQLED